MDKKYCIFDMDGTLNRIELFIIPTYKEVLQKFAGAQADDQKRIMTPALAREGGSDFIVVGRPITQAPDPVAAYRRCVREFLGQ